MNDPVLGCLDVLESALKDVADVAPAFMSTAQKRAALVAHARVKAQLDELGLRVLAAAGDVAADDGARDAASWVDHHNRVDRTTARRDQRLAEALDERWRIVQAAMRAGAVSAEQAHVITRALDRVPDRVDAAVRVLAEEQERKALEAEEAAAETRTWLTGRRRGNGRTALRGDLPDAAWDRLETYLEAYTSPRRLGEDPDNPDDRRPYEMKLGAAFVSFLEHLDPTRLPIHGGDATTVVVTIDHATLADQVGSSGVALIDDVPISAAAVRRLACTTSIIPAVLGGKSEILDLGRSRRLFSRAQRKALRLEHKRCRARGCRIKAAWTEAHHLRRPWSQGGSTDLDDGTLLCCFHHQRAHDPRYETRVDAEGDVTFHRRT